MRQAANKDGMGMGPKKPTRGGIEKSMFILPAGAAIKAAKSAADLAKMGYKIVPIPGKKKK
jgi:hypothetical protein